MTITASRSPYQYGHGSARSRRETLEFEAKVCESLVTEKFLKKLVFLELLACMASMAEVTLLRNSRMKRKTGVLADASTFDR